MHTLKTVNRVRVLLLNDIVIVVYSRLIVQIFESVTKQPLDVC